MHFHVPFHPMGQHGWINPMNAVNLVLILLGMLLAILVGPVQLD